MEFCFSYCFCFPHTQHKPIALWPTEDVTWVKDIRRRCFLKMFIYLFQERERERGNMHRKGRERERIPTRVHAVSAEPDVGLNPTNCEIMTWVKIKSWEFNKLSHPGSSKEGTFIPCFSMLCGPTKIVSQSLWGYIYTTSQIQVFWSN